MGSCRQPMATVSADRRITTLVKLNCGLQIDLSKKVVFIKIPPMSTFIVTNKPLLLNHKHFYSYKQILIINNNGTDCCTTSITIKTKINNRYSRIRLYPQLVPKPKCPDPKACIRAWGKKFLQAPKYGQPQGPRTTLSTCTLSFFSPDGHISRVWQYQFFGYAPTPALSNPGRNSQNPTS